MGSFADSMLKKCTPCFLCNVLLLGWGIWFSTVKLSVGLAIDRDCLSPMRFCVYLTYLAKLVVVVVGRPYPLKWMPLEAHVDSLIKVYLMSQPYKPLGVPQVGTLEMWDSSPVLDMKSRRYVFYLSPALFRCTSHKSLQGLRKYGLMVNVTRLRISCRTQWLSWITWPQGTSMQAVAFSKSIVPLKKKNTCMKISQVEHYYWHLLREKFCFRMVTIYFSE